MPYERLEPCEGKLSRTVLRGGIGSNVNLLPDHDVFGSGGPDSGDHYILAIGHDVLLFHVASISHLRSKKVYAISLIKR